MSRRMLQFPRQKTATDLAADVLKQSVGLIVQYWMDAEVSRELEAEKYERNPIRRAYRNGYRQRAWETRLGNITLKIPKLRKGTYYPTLLDEDDIEETLLDCAFQIVMNILTGRLSEPLESVEHPMKPHELAELHEQLYDLVLSQNPTVNAVSQLRLEILDDTTHHTTIIQPTSFMLLQKVA